MKRYMKVAAIFAVITAAVACERSTPPPTAEKLPTKSDTFRIALAIPEWALPRNADQYHFHPHYMSHWTSFFTHEQLVDDTGDFGLAESISISDDGKEAIVELHKGVLFHDGLELTADDVIYSIASFNKGIFHKRKSSSLTSSDFILNFNIEKIDSHKLAIRAKRPVDFLEELRDIEIINAESRKIFENKGQTISTPEGTGPYQITGVDVEKNTVILTANPKYRLGAPRIKKITTAFFTTAEAASMAVLTNKADYIPSIVDKEILGKPRGVTLFPYELNYCNLIILNTSKPHLRDARVRRALSMLIERDRLTSYDNERSIRRHPTETFLNNSYPKTTPVWSPANGREAIKLFTEAGLKYVEGDLFNGKKPFTINISIPHVAMTDQVVKTLREITRVWQNAGITCDLKNANVEAIGMGEFDAYFTEFLERKSVSTTMESLFKVDEALSEFKLKLADIQLKQLIKSIRNETREDVLLEKKLAIQERLKETCPLIPLYYETRYGALAWTHNSDKDVKKAIEKDPGALSYLARLR